MVERATMTAYASDQSATAKAATVDVQIATWGLLYFAETLATNDDAGSPPSRANANSMREFEVTDESPQNHIAPITTHTKAPPSRAPSAVSSTKMNGLSAAAAAGRSTMATVMARSMHQPT